MINHEERKKIGRKAIYAGILGNVTLTIFNFTVGILSGSSALIAEAAHTFSDILTSIIAFIGFRVSLKSPTKYNHYGYGRAEPLAGLVIVIFLVIVAYEIFSEVYVKLLSYEQLVAPDYTAALMALAGIAINIVLTTYIMKQGKKINSHSIIADANHQKVDIFSCAALMGGIIGSNMGMPILDPIIALFIGIIVLKTAYNIARENIDVIIGTLPSKELCSQIKDAAMDVNGIYGVHDLKVNFMGSYASTELHIEVDSDLNIREAHRMAHEVERNIINKVKLVSAAGIHVCPVSYKK